MADQDATSRPVVLIANDQEWSARSLESILSPSGYTVLRAYTGKQALERVREGRPDLIILDAQMPDMHGFDVCRALREELHLSATVPVIITTAGPSGRAQRLEAYQAGAWEFLGQPLDGEALLLKLQTFLRSKMEVDRLREEALLDPETGLYSRKGLARRAREIAADASRRREALACVVFGTETGTDGAIGTAPTDEEQHRISEWLGQVFRRASRGSDAVGRLSLTEFAVVAPATGPAGAARLADRLTGEVESAPMPMHIGDRWIRVKAGYAAVPDFADSPVDALELLLRAASALHDLQKDGAPERVRSFESPSLGFSN